MRQRELEGARILWNPKGQNTRPEYPDKEQRLGDAPGAEFTEENDQPLAVGLGRHQSVRLPVFSLYPAGHRTLGSAHTKVGKDGEPSLAP
jgi:hypothetical protein